jgi:IS5 family transposase
MRWGVHAPIKRNRPGQRSRGNTHLKSYGSAEQWFQSHPPAPTHTVTDDGASDVYAWFLDLNVGDRAFNATTFSKNRARLLEHAVADAFFAEVVAEAKRRHLLSSEHFTVDGTLLEAWASLKSYRPRDEDDDEHRGPGGRNSEVDFRGQRRSRETHASRTDPEAQLATKGSGQTAKLCYMGHVLTENRNGLVVGVALTEADGFAERKAALALLDRCVSGRATLGADRGYDSRDFVAHCRERRVTPHVAQNLSRRSAVDGRTTRHPGYAVSQRLRKRVEEVFGWAKTVGGLRKLRYIGRARNELCATLTAAAYNLVRMAKLEAVAT